MSVVEALRRRSSIRAFDARPVPAEIVERVIATALEAPSWSNTQPFKVAIASGATRDALAAELSALYDKGTRLLREKPVMRAVKAVLGGVAPDRDYRAPERYPPELLARRRATGFGLYGQLGIARDDHAARDAQMRRNFQFFDAPVGLFVFAHEALGAYAVLDAGHFMMALMLAAEEEGLGTCAQAALATWKGPVVRRFAVPEGYKLLCGMALGYPAKDAPVNRFRPKRAPLKEFIIAPSGG